MRAGRIEIELYQKEVRSSQKLLVSPSGSARQKHFRKAMEIVAVQAPKAVENFRCLCTGERGKLKSSGKLGHYKVSSVANISTWVCRASIFLLICKSIVPQGCKFHRIVKGFICQSGDFVKGKHATQLIWHNGCHFADMFFPCWSYDVRVLDAIQGDGSGGDSIYGGRFQDDKAALKGKHDILGVVGMANSGKNSK